MGRIGMTRSGRGKGSDGVIEIHDNHVENVTIRPIITDGKSELILKTLPLVGLLPWPFSFLEMCWL